MQVVLLKAFRVRNRDGKKIAKARGDTAEVTKKLGKQLVELGIAKAP